MASTSGVKFLGLMSSATFRASFTASPSSHLFGSRNHSMFVSSTLSPRFAAMWAEHEVEVRGPMLKHVNHPQAGPMEFECQVLYIADTGQRLIAYCAAPGSATEAAFRRLALRPSA